MIPQLCNSLWFLEISDRVHIRDQTTTRNLSMKILKLFTPVTSSSQHCHSPRAPNYAKSNLWPEEIFHGFLLQDQIDNWALQKVHLWRMLSNSWIGIIKTVRPQTFDKLFIYCRCISLWKFQQIEEDRVQWIVESNWKHECILHD